jgi:hypothetical protein
MQRAGIPSEFHFTLSTYEMTIIEKNISNKSSSDLLIILVVIHEIYVFGSRLRISKDYTPI